MWAFGGIQGLLLSRAVEVRGSPFVCLQDSDMLVTELLAFAPLWTASRRGLLIAGRAPFVLLALYCCAAQVEGLESVEDGKVPEITTQLCQSLL